MLKHKDITESNELAGFSFHASLMVIFKWHGKLACVIKVCMFKTDGLICKCSSLLSLPAT